MALSLSSLVAVAAGVPANEIALRGGRSGSVRSGQAVERDRLVNSMGAATDQSSSSRDRDSDLVRRIAAGQDDALRELYALYGQRLYSYAVRITHSHAMAEDVVQESLLGVWTGAGRFRGDGRVLAWLLSIVHHKALNAVRGRPPAASHEQAARLADTGPSLDECLAQDEQRQQLRAGLARLSVEHRTVLELVFYQGLSLGEAAHVCGCPVGTVKSRLHYAKSRLRGVLVRIGIGAEERA